MAKSYSKPASLLPIPNGYCPGCLHATASKIIAELIDEIGKRDETILVLPVGCSTMGLLYFNLDMAESAHGRAPAVATGVKRCRPDQLVFTYQGDGDLAAIGLAEILSAANRGEHFTVIFANNGTYGMTGGQMAPTTLPGQKSTTCRAGRDPSDTGYPLKMCELIDQLDAPAFIARFALNNPANIRKAKAGIRRAFELQLVGHGFTFVELLTNCPTNWGMPPLKSLEYMEETSMKYFPQKVFRDREAQK